LKVNIRHIQIFKRYIERIRGYVQALSVTKLYANFTSRFS
jgi:hypothetical protein